MVSNKTICRESQHQLRPKNCSEESYPLYCAAKDLYLGTKHITINDLADNKLIGSKTFALICNAMAIRKFGLGAVRYIEKNPKPPTPKSRIIILKKQS